MKVEGVNSLGVITKAVCVSATGMPAISIFLGHDLHDAGLELIVRGEAVGQNANVARRPRQP